MKNIFLLSFLILINKAICQENIGVYTSSYTSKEFSIEATEPDENGDYKLFITMYSLDNSISEGGILLKKKDINDFVGLLEDVKTKFIEWDSLAKANNVEKLDKVIPTTHNPKCGGFFKYGSWKFDYSVTLSPRFLKTESGTFALIHTGKMIASDNQYMDADDFVFVFSNTAEIVELLALMDITLVENHYNKKKSTDDLFH